MADQGDVLRFALDQLAPHFAIRRPCLWCAAPLVFHVGRGWLHEGTGDMYVRRIGADGIERDDHCATPDMTVPPLPRSQ